MENPQPVAPGYSLRTGSSAAHRLALVDRVYGTRCQEIMSGLGITTGIRVADIGCGTGTTARWFSTKVGVEGEVCCVDSSSEQLEVARNLSKSEEFRNMRFVEGDAAATGLPRHTFDVVHCRLLLMHLVKPFDAIREMATIAKPGGLVICCDLDNVSKLATYPATNCYHRIGELMSRARAGLGFDLDLGMKLPRLLSQAGLEHPEIAMVQPVHLRGEEKRLWEYTFFEADRAGSLELAEREKLAGELASVAADNTTAVVHVAMPVCWARKPHPRG